MRKLNEADRTSGGRPIDSGFYGPSGSADGPTNCRLASAAEDLQIDQPPGVGQRSVPDGRANERRRNVHRLQLDERVGRKATITEHLEAGDIIGSNVQRPKLDEFVGGKTCGAGTYEALDPLRSDVQSFELEQVI